MGTLTYEKLFDYLREERNSASLQKLPSSFYSEVIDYLKAKEASIEALNGSGSMVVDNSLIQFRNAKKIIENIYERREKKILMLGLNKSRTKSQLIDISALLPEEKILFKQLSIVFDHFRDEILIKILNKSLPDINEQKDSVIPESAIFSLENRENLSSGVDVIDSLDSESDSSFDSSLVSVRFKKYVDKFVGPDLDILGPFEEGDVERFPKEVAEVVVSKDLADLI